MEYYSALKKILPCGTAWMTLEDAMLSEISQSQKDKSFFFSQITLRLSSIISGIKNRGDHIAAV